MSGVTATRAVVRRGTPQDADQWNRFLDRCDVGNFYLRHEWLELNHRVLGHPVIPLVAEHGGAVVGILPLVRVRSPLFGDILASMPFVNLGGIAAAGPEVESLLLEEACRTADALRCDYLELRSDRPLGGLPASTRKVSMSLDLPGDPGVLWGAFSSKHRTNIRRVQKEGIRVEAGGMGLLDPFYFLMERSWRGLGTPLYRKAYFRSILESFGEGVRIFVAFRGDVPVAAALNGEYRGVVEGMWAAADPALRSLQPNYVLYWAMLEDACLRGFRRYHLGRSTAGSGAEQFKAKWGAVPTQLYWNYHLVRARELPGLNPDNPKYRQALALWRRLPLPLLRVAGPPLARLIP